MLLFLVLQELGLDHFDLLAFLLFLDAQVVLLLGSHVGLDQVHVVGVAAEDALVVHDVKSLTSLGVHLIVEALGV